MHRALTAIVAAILLVFASPAPPRAAEGGSGLTLLEPYGPGSVTDRIAEVLKPGLEKRTGKAVEVEHAGPAALDRLASAAPDSGTVLIVDLLSVEVADAVGKATVKMASLTPVAKLTGPGSVALVVPEGSAIRSWADFAAAAKAGKLSIASPGRVSAAGVPLALMEKALGVRFTDVAALGRAEILDALATTKADAGFLVTGTLLPAPNAPAPPVRALVTFGAQRNPGLKQVPTFQEAVGQPHNSITSAIALFGPAGMKPATLAAIAADFAAAGKAAGASGAIAASRLPIEIGDAALLRETMARDAGVIKRVVELLR